MQTVVGSLVYKIVGDTAQFNSSMNSTKQLIGRFVSAGTLVMMGKQFLTLASNAEELSNKFNVVFKGIEKDTDAWVKKYAKDVSRGANATKTFLSSLQDIRTGFGDNTKDAAEFSKAVVGITNDLSSFSNVPFEQASAAIQSGLNGQFEALRSLGVGLNVNIINQGKYAESLGKTWEKMDNLERQEAILSGIVSQSTNAIGQSVESWEEYNYQLGDAARTSDSYANTMQGVKGQLEDVGAQMGEAFLPLATNVLGGLSSMLDLFTEMPTPIKATTVAVIGLGLALKALSPVTAIISGVAVGAMALVGALGKQDDASGDLRDSYKNLKEMGTKYKDVVTELTGGTTDLTDVQKEQLELQKKLYESQMRSEMRKASTAFDGVQEQVESARVGLGLLEEMRTLASDPRGLLGDPFADVDDENEIAFNRWVGDVQRAYNSLATIASDVGLSDKFNNFKNDLLKLPSDEYQNLHALLNGNWLSIQSFSEDELSEFQYLLNGMGTELELFYHDTFGELEGYAKGIAKSIVLNGLDQQVVYGFSIDTDWEREVDQWVQKLKVKLDEEQTKLKDTPLEGANDIARRMAYEIINLPPNMAESQRDNIIQSADDLTMLWVKALEGDAEAIQEVYRRVFNPPKETADEDAVSELTQHYLDATQEVKQATEELGKTDQEVLDIQRQRAYDAATNDAEKQAAKELYDALDAQLKKEQEIAEERAKQDQMADATSQLEDYEFQLETVGLSEVEVAKLVKERALEHAVATGMTRDDRIELSVYHNTLIATAKAQEQLTQELRDYNEVQSIVLEAENFRAGNSAHPEADRIKAMTARATELRDAGKMTEEQYKQVTAAYQEMMDKLHYSQKPLEDWEWDDWANAALDACGQILSEMDKLVTAIYQKQIDMQDQLLQAELEARGLLEEEEENKYTKQRQDAEKELIDLQADIKKETNLEKKQEMEKEAAGKAVALDKLQREEHDEEQRLAIKKKYEQEKARLEYESAMWSWGIQLVQATVGVARSIAENAANPVLAALAGIVGAMQIATISMTKPQKPQFALGALEVPRDMEAIIHQGEMILPRPFAEDVRQGKIAVGGAGGSGGNSNVKVEIYTSEPVETEEIQEGELTKLKVFVGQAWLEAYGKGQFDNPMKSRHGLTKRGIR